MRIMQVITLCGLGGAQSVVANLSNELCKEHEVIVVAGEGDGKLWNMLDARIIQERVPTLRRSLSPIKDAYTIMRFKYLYRKYKPNVVQLHSSKAAMLGRLAFSHKKIIYTVHGFDSIRLAYRKYLPIERFMQKRCSAIVGVSKYDCVNLKVEKINTKITCIYNGIYAMKEPKEKTIEIPDIYKKKILCIARLSPPKNLDIFLNLAKELPEYAFIWIGNQSEVTDAPKNSFFLGNMENAGQYNYLVDLFILPSNYEGLPMVILEAMSAGKPVVASDVGGIKEIIINGENGYTVKNTTEDFTEKIRYILENEDVYKRFSTTTQKRFQEKFTVRTMAENYMKLYNDIIVSNKEKR